MKDFLNLSSAEFFCFKDAKANVVALLDNTGAVVVKYKYDAWGKIIAMDSASSMESSALTYNPLRCRGYIYDNETGRFMNADTGGM